MTDASKPGSTHSWLAAVLATLISALFFGLNAVASKLLFSPAAPAHFDAVSLFVARGFWSLPLFLVLALATMPHAFPHSRGGMRAYSPCAALPTDRGRMHYLR